MPMGRVREAEERLHKRLSDHREPDEKIPVLDRPQVERPRCPVDGVLLETRPPGQTLN